MSADVSVLLNRIASGSDRYNKCCRSLDAYQNRSKFDGGNLIICAIENLGMPDVMERQLDNIWGRNGQLNYCM